MNPFLSGALYVAYANVIVDSDTASFTGNSAQEDGCAEERNLLYLCWDSWGDVYADGLSEKEPSSVPVSRRYLHAVSNGAKARKHLMLAHNRCLVACGKCSPTQTTGTIFMCGVLLASHVSCPSFMSVSPATDTGAVAALGSSSLTIDSLASFVNNVAEANGGNRANVPPSSSFWSEYMAHDSPTVCVLRTTEWTGFRTTTTCGTSIA